MKECSFSSAAYADVVLLLSEMPASLKPISIAELHLFCYLSNLLALVRGLPLADWGYRFAITADGFPHAEALNRAVDWLSRVAALEVNGGLIFALEPRFSEEVEMLLSLAQGKRRQQWVRTAALCALNLPKGVIRQAINKSPGFSAHLQQRRVSSLLDASDRDDLYDEFAVIKEVLGDAATDQLQPAILWLSAKVMAKE